MISKTVTPDRSKIILEHEDHIKYWTRHFGVAKDDFLSSSVNGGETNDSVQVQGPESLQDFLHNALKNCLGGHGLAVHRVCGESKW